MYLSEKRIWHQKTVPYTPMRNGVVEPLNHHLGESKDNALVGHIKVGVLGRSTVDGYISDKSFVVESNQARSAASTMVREGTGLR